MAAHSSMDECDPHLVKVWVEATREVWGLLVRASPRERRFPGQLHRYGVTCQRKFL